MAESKTNWYEQSPAQVAQQLGVDPQKGLSKSEAQARLQKYGPNQLAAKKKESGAQAFLRQYKDFMQLLLLGAAIVNFIFQQPLGTTILLLGLTVLNAVMGMNQESKAAASLEALQKMLKNIARVRRDGEAIEVDASELAPGDVVLIEAGNRVPADGRLFVAATLEIEEAALTGESAPTLKDMATIDKEVGLGDRLNMVFMNTAVTRGRGEFIVTATGMSTEMGHIADLLNKTEADKTPLQKQLDRLTIVIAAIAGVAFLLMLYLGITQNGQTFSQVFLAGIALAISAIPTGLPAVITTLYSMGTRELAKQNAIVKRLPSVETLGSVSAICSDKTGTLTLNKMTAREFTIPGQNRYKVTGEGYGVKGELQYQPRPGAEPWQKGTTPYTTEGQILSPGGPKINLEPIMLPMALCADARLDGETLIGDPTEGALIVLAAKGGIDLEGARQQYPRIAEVPFDSDYKFMATFHNMTDAQGKKVVRCFVKGAPDVLIARGGFYWLPDESSHPITEENRQLALNENERMAKGGERVMVVAQRDFDPATFDPKAKLIDLVNDLTLLAMVGIVDPPRAEAKDAIAKCKSAGIQVRMITGDHAVTAAAIGQELGITGKALSGKEFAALSDDQLMKDLPEIGVVARVAPEDKIRLVTMLQKQNNIVAMTGDGVNDAPALKKADIGVAMGITGTEVSKEAAVMILTDDNFATIVKAVEYGRALYDNLSKYIRYQMTSLVSFIACFLGAALFFIAGGTPFNTLMVLWINFAITVPIAIALGFDTPSPGLMERKPRPLKQPVLSRNQWIRIVFLGVIMAAGTLILEQMYYPTNAVLGLTIGATAFSLYNVFVGLSSRSETRSAFNREILSDRRQVMLYGITIILIILSTSLGVLQRLLNTTELSGDQWLLCIAVALSVLVADEVIKFFMRRRAKPAAESKAAPAPAAE